ncbi:hypothetical protein UlMin_034798 [Ulmus minor]
MGKTVRQSSINTSISRCYSLPPPQWVRFSTIPTTQTKMGHRRTLILNSSNLTTGAGTWSSNPSVSTSSVPAPPVVRRRNRYRKQYPGESKGITEEMRFVAMKLRNINGKKYSQKHNETTDSDEDSEDSTPSEDDEGNSESLSDEDDNGGETETWQPSIEGFLKYLVDSELVFNTVERIVDDSNDVAYAYFRKTGLERSESLLKDIEWFKQEGMEIPEPSNPGVSYVKYLEELAEKSAPQFLCHFYNIYFSHIAGGQVIVKHVSEKLLDGRELELYRWEGEVQESLKGVREKLNMVGEHWSRDEKNKCLREAAKSFRFLGQIVRLIIL